MSVRFDKEPETLQIMADYMSERRMQKNGVHHEIYLSDFRKTAPEKAQNHTAGAGKIGVKQKGWDS